MKRIAIFVEGQTEQIFVNKLLNEFVVAKFVRRKKRRSRKERAMQTR